MNNKLVIIGAGETANLAHEYILHMIAIIILLRLLFIQNIEMRINLKIYP